MYRMSIIQTVCLRQQKESCEILGETERFTGNRKDYMDLEHKSIERIRLASEMSLHHYGKPLVCTYSGGKDSDVMLELFKRSGAPFEVVNSHTTVDAPPTVYHIRKKFSELENQGIKAAVHKPGLSMWELIVKKKIPPTGIARYCCEYLKENTVKNRFVATGVRWAESSKRKKRQEIEPGRKDLAIKIMALNDNDRKRALTERCKMKSDMILNPILDWPDKDIWEYYWNECTLHNPLYKMGYYRVGCVGCPMAGKSRWKEFADFPTYKRAYIRAFGKMLEAIHGTRGITRWKTGYDVFSWWMKDSNVPGQISFGDYSPFFEENGEVQNTDRRDYRE